MKSTFLKFPIAAALLLGACSVGFTGRAACAQSSAGIVVGTVTDATGAVIPDALVTLTDVTTKATRTVHTNKEGAYAMPDVVPGAYDISASKAGFSTDQIAGQVVSVGTQTTANFKMAVGAENTTIEVHGLQRRPADDERVAPATPSIPPWSNPSRHRPRRGHLRHHCSPALPPAATSPAPPPTRPPSARWRQQHLRHGRHPGRLHHLQRQLHHRRLSRCRAPGGVVPMPQDSIEEFKVSTTGQTADFNNSSGSQSQIVTKRGHDQLARYRLRVLPGQQHRRQHLAEQLPRRWLYTPKPSYHYSRFGCSSRRSHPPEASGRQDLPLRQLRRLPLPAAATYRARCSVL